MNKGSYYFRFTFISALIALLIGYVLYVYPKNYEILEIEAKNDNYSTVGLFLGGVALAMTLVAMLIAATTKRRMLLGIEIILSIILLILWWRY